MVVADQEWGAFGDCGFNAGDFGRNPFFVAFPIWTVVLVVLILIMKMMVVHIALTVAIGILQMTAVNRLSPIFFVRLFACRAYHRFILFELSNNP